MGKYLIRSLSDLGNYRSAFDDMVLEEFRTMEVVEASVCLLRKWRAHYGSFRYQAVPASQLLREIAVPLLRAQLYRAESILA